MPISPSHGTRHPDVLPGPEGRQPALGKSRNRARGSVTPLASTYTSEGRICRDFLASYVRGTNEGWLQGEACQQNRGEAKGPWEIRHMKPWKRS
jgi:surface antigen